MFVMNITMRMRQYSYSKNIKAKQLNKTKKKVIKTGYFLNNKLYTFFKYAKI